LRRVMEAWPELPEAIRRAVLALVDSAAPAAEPSGGTKTPTGAESAETSKTSRRARRARPARRRKKPEP